VVRRMATGRWRREGRMGVKKINVTEIDADAMYYLPILYID